MRGSGIMLRRLNDALPGLVLGIIVYGAAVFLAGIWFVPDKLRFTTGLAIGIVFFVMMKWELGSLPAAFIGVLGLKISAYLQPLAHRFISKLGGRGDVPSDSRENEAL